ncbi:dockerin-like protein [uncultured Draconibacterium sp.]|uniref:glucuronyl esterase domain-containing protein n=1 Tax=uncultured Draconibacterium sp. TaxID=1573823 RepID=UPI00326162CE
MHNKLSLLLLAVFTLMLLNACKQEIPLVYSVECTKSVAPEEVATDTADLKIVAPLTDPFAWSNGQGRSEKFADWSRRRAEIGAEIQYYEIGPKPSRPDSIDAIYTGDSLTITITRNGQSLKLVSHIILPEGEGPFPAVIGIGKGSGSLPEKLFSERQIAQVSFQFWDVMAWEQKRGQEPINKLYPELTFMGAYSAWSWGISRLIDGLELVADEVPIDLQHLAITGCSFAGKMALFGGAFDQRIALTIAQESGGGGAAAWRVSETLGNVETLGRTSHLWFTEDLFKFSKSVEKLPYDHHELMAMVAPRALLVLGNPDYEWLAEESGYVSCRAAQRVWETFGIKDRFGFSIVAGHPHCRLPEEQYPEVEAFIEKFLLGNTEINTVAEIHPYPNVDYKKWTAWWGSNNPVFPKTELKNQSAEKIN